MKKLFLLLFLSVPVHAGLVTTYDTNRITVNIGSDNLDGHAVLYVKGSFKLLDTTPASKFCVLIDPLKLSTTQGFGDTTLYNLIWYTPACSATGNIPPCLPDGAVTMLNDLWCQ